MSHVLPITWHLIISLCFSTQNWFLIFPASIGNTLRNPPLYLDGQVKHHIQVRSDSLTTNSFFTGEKGSLNFWEEVQNDNDLAYTLP